MNPTELNSDQFRWAWRYLSVTSCVVDQTGMFSSAAQLSDGLRLAHHPANTLQMSVLSHKHTHSLWRALVLKTGTVTWSKSSIWSFIYVLHYSSWTSSHTAWLSTCRSADLSEKQASCSFNIQSGRSRTARIQTAHFLSGGQSKPSFPHFWLFGLVVKRRLLPTQLMFTLRSFDQESYRTLTSLPNQTLACQPTHVGHFKPSSCTDEINM